MPTEPNSATPEFESPSADEMEGAPGPRPQPSMADAPDHITDQDIDVAGTDADPQSPTRAIGTGIAQPDKKG
jgi:hypothetical protein